MSPVLLTKFMTSMKKEAVIVLVVIGMLLALPFVALISLSDIENDLGAIADSVLHPYEGPASTTNTYTFGYCTFWAAKRREEIGKAIPNTWGDAHTWDERSRAMGYTVDHIPQVGAVMETDRGALGHVAFVEEVKPDGTWRISQMNAPIWNTVTDHTFTAAQAQDYNFIH